MLFPLVPGFQVLSRLYMYNLIDSKKQFNIRKQYLNRYGCEGLLNWMLYLFVLVFVHIRGKYKLTHLHILNLNLVM
jgi:hypothetical protein